MSLMLRVAERALNRPLLIHPDKVPLILGVLEGRIPLDVASWRESAQRRIDDMPEAARVVMRGPRPKATRFVGDPVDTDPETRKKKMLPYRRHQGVAMIEVIGSLINRGAWTGSQSGETSYEGLKFQLDTALADPRTHAVMLDIESPGGEAVGAFEIADTVRTVAARKPVVAVVNGMAASAAYAIASAASRIVTAPTGVVGSIGVVMLHADYSRYLDRQGVTPTLIYAGAHKVDGNPVEPLTDEVRGDLQAEVDLFYRLFLDSVAKGGRLTVEQARATEARTYIGADAVRVGLADAVGTFDDVLSDLMRRPQGGAQLPPKGNAMNSPQTAAPAAATDTVSRAAHEAAVASANAQLDATVKAAADKARAEGIAAEASRQAGIDRLAMPGHEALVAQLKADPSCTVEQAAIRLIEAEKLARGRQLEAIKAVEGEAAGKTPASARSSDAPAAPALPAATTPEGWKAEFAANPALAAEFVTADDYVAFKANESKVRILRK